MAKKVEKDPAAQSLGARGGKKTWANVSPEERSKRMAMLAKRRWKTKEK